MNKLMTVVAASVCAVSLSGSAVAAEDVSADKKVTTAEAEALEEEEDQIFEAGLDLDFFSAYVWRNVVQTDKPVFEPCVWADLTYFDPFWIGFSYWQNWDLSDDRRGSEKDFRRRLNESDYNVHIGVTAWENEDEDMSLEFEGGHEWYTYHFDHGVPSTREFYLKGTFNNPIVNVYGQVSWLYDDIGEYDSGFYYEVGFNKEFELCESLALGLDWNTSLGDGDYNYFMTGAEESGFLGTTLKAYLSWAVTDWMSVVGTIAYTGLLDSDIRHEYNAGNAWGDRDDKDILWGGLSLKFSY